MNEPGLSDFYPEAEGNLLESRDPVTTTMADQIRKTFRAKEQKEARREAEKPAKIMREVEAYARFIDELKRQLDELQGVNDELLTMQSYEIEEKVKTFINDLLEKNGLSLIVNPRGIAIRDYKVISEQTFSNPTNKKKRIKLKVQVQDFTVLESLRLMLQKSGRDKLGDFLQHRAGGYEDPPYNTAIKVSASY
jgi:hypothetical protein